ncbi:ABC transporter ATP-binding protein [Microbulbifer harenosus]|uniref:ABC transporter ATP-binding protein n=1 Tax=Microbulbifer harenosus TaxID=2576840 RepID=A0ABY2UKF2_9GAMM|nr:MULTISPECIES: ABC transporter ATP-binding protein [Microbulbifer]QIL89350.1 ATP-binding cassette domain-containing protein [Microbulbifer sp. SH-1]TLM78652.1 ABC transporter ATP-binding protein [Microbulbifer harenosus]
MTVIDFKNASVDFPIYNAGGRSLKKRLMQVATGGQISADGQGRVIVRALEDLSFEFSEGECVGLVGHNGAGKSTLLRVLSGVYSPTEGEVSIRGAVGSLIDISLGIDQEATGRENIYIRGALLGLSRRKIDAALDNIIDFAELGDFIDMPVRTYSSGMHLRLAFSVSTIVRPDILIMDEWLSVGDEGFKQKAESRMSELVSSSKIVVIASHSKDLILNMCNRAIWLEHGRIRMDGSASDVCSAYFGG